MNNALVKMHNDIYFFILLPYYFSNVILVKIKYTSNHIQCIYDILGSMHYLYSYYLKRHASRMDKEFLNIRKWFLRLTMRLLVIHWTMIICGMYWLLRYSHSDSHSHSDTCYSVIKIPRRIPFTLTSWSDLIDDEEDQQYETYEWQDNP